MTQLAKSRQTAVSTYLSDHIDSIHNWQVEDGQTVDGAVDRAGMNADAVACYAENQENAELRLYENWKEESQTTSARKQKKQKHVHETIVLYTEGGKRHSARPTLTSLHLSPSNGPQWLET
jgi:hypothetical protein